MTDAEKLKKALEFIQDLANYKDSNPYEDDRLEIGRHYAKEDIADDASALLDELLFSGKGLEE